MDIAGISHQLYRCNAHRRPNMPTAGRERPFRQIGTHVWTAHSGERHDLPLMMRTQRLMALFVSFYSYLFIFRENTV